MNFNREHHLNYNKIAVGTGLQAGSNLNYFPLKLHPCYKEYLWGGERLKMDYGKSDAPEITAESWELAARVDGVSKVFDGPFAGRSLLELEMLDHEGFWGRNCQGDGFPLLVKFIDAKKNLSIQVHPSDKTADYTKGERGKAEMWFIMDCEPQSSIYFGFSKHISKTEFLHRAEDGSICEVLNHVQVKKGDVFYILPGTIHAIGAGIVLAEIQQNSNTTFRIYDYLRRDARGNLRPLHLKRASEVLDYEPVNPGECRANAVATFPEFMMTELFSCQYFKVHRLDVKVKAGLFCDGSSFQHLLCVCGEGKIISDGLEYPVKKGESYFLPAALGEYQVSGACSMLLSRVWEEER